MLSAACTSGYAVLWRCQDYRHVIQNCYRQHAHRDTQFSGGVKLQTSYSELLSAGHAHQDTELEVSSYRQVIQNCYRQHAHRDTQFSGGVKITDRLFRIVIGRAWTSGYGVLWRCQVTDMSFFSKSRVIRCLSAEQSALFKRACLFTNHVHILTNKTNSTLYGYRCNI